MKKVDSINTNYQSVELAEIENKRKEFVPIYHRNEKIEKLVFFLGLIVIIFAGLILPSIWPDAGFVRFILMVVPAIGLIVYALLAKKIVNNKARIFFSTFYRNSVKFALDQKGITDVVPMEPSEIKRTLFDENLLYKDVTQVNSKGYTTFKYNKKEISVTDAAAITGFGKKMAVAFTGKYLVSAANYVEKDRIVIYLKGTEKPLPPTNLEGLKEVLNDDSVIIYTNNTNWKKTISSDVLKQIKKIETNALLADVAICLNNKKIFVCLGYDDPLMVPPFNEPFNTKPLEQYKKDLGNVLQLLEVL